MRTSRAVNAKNPDQIKSDRGSPYEHNFLLLSSVPDRAEKLWCDGLLASDFLLSQFAQPSDVAFDAAYLIEQD